MIPLFKVLMSKDAGEALLKTLYSGYIGQGPKVDEFEKAFAKAVDAPDFRLLTTNACTSAIDLALHLCGVKPGDEVVVSPMTCSATITPIINRHAIPVWADVDPDTGNIDPLDAHRKATSKTKAVVAVNWGGRLCDYASLHEIGLPVIEDAAHNLSPHYGGDYVCWSFQAIKFLTTGDGGAILVPEHQAERARLLRWYGLDRRSGESFRCSQNIQEAGYKYHMNDLAATLGLCNLPEALEASKKAQQNALYYEEHLKSSDEFTKMPVGYPNDVWLYTILAKDRIGFGQVLKDRGVASSPVHTRCDRHPAFMRAAGKEYRLPGLDHFASRNLAIPVGWWLSEADRDCVVQVLNEA
jgi:dTDP-4-amino-4,6-dideoxygalactose transaminase